MFGFSGLKKLQKIQKRFMASPVNPEEDHPRVKEMRRRMVEVVTELRRANLL